MSRRRTLSRQLRFESLEERKLMDSTGLTGSGQPISQMQPSLALNYIVAFNGIFPSRDRPLDDSDVLETPYLGEVRLFSGNFAPSGYAFASGQLLSISQNNALFALLGTTFGGNGRTTFALPDLRGRVPMKSGAGPGLSSLQNGETFGSETNVLTVGNLPSHSHSIPTGSTSMIGAGQAFSNYQPSLALTVGLASEGNFDNLGEFRFFAFNFDWSPDYANGQTVAIADNNALFAKLGTTYGGNGQTNFVVPDARGRALMGVGQGPGLSSNALGQSPGSANTTLVSGNLPQHSHTTATGATGATGAAASTPYSQLQPSLGAKYYIRTEGIYPPQGGFGGGGIYLGEVRAFAATSSPLSAWTAAEGQLLPIAGNDALFSIIGTTYGGNGTTTFALPDMRGRLAIGAGQGPGLSNYIVGQQVGSESTILTVPRLPAHSHITSADILVTSLGDTLNPSDNATVLTLREAILAAEGTPYDETIRFAPVLTSGGPAVITLALGQLSMTNSSGATTIIGPGANLLSVNGNSNFRILDVGSGVMLNVDGLTIQNGSSSDGGGIRNHGRLSVNDSIFHSNQTSSDGGAIRNTGTLSVSGSTFTANTSEFSAGAIGVYEGGSALIVNSTFSDNSAKFFGGAIDVNGSTVAIANSTIVSNRAQATDGGTGNGGGISNFGTITLQSTIIAGNLTSTSNLADDLANTPVQPSSSNNLIGNVGSSGGLLHGINGNIVGNNGAGTLNLVSILNTTLGNRGGTTPTHTLVAGSLAIDAAIKRLYQDEVLADSPRIYYRLNETSGTSIDDASVNNLDGSLTGGGLPPNFLLGQPSLPGLGTSPRFNNGQPVSAIQVPALGTQAAISIEAWVKPTSRTDSFDTIYNTRNFDAGAVHLQFIVTSFNDVGGLRFTINGAGEAEFGTDASFPLNEWTHVVATYSNANDEAQVFANGISLGTAIFSGNQDAVLGLADVGAWNTNDREFDGQIDEVAIYTTALSAARVQAHYRSGFVAASDQRGMPRLVDIPGINDLVGVGDIGAVEWERTVANRQIFYNRSTSTAFGDGSGNPINSIDSTRIALLPGQTSTAANYTNYIQGINGILIDAFVPATVTIDDLSFATGSGVTAGSFTPLSNTITPQLTVFAGAGIGGSTRLKIEFPNASIINTWLRVTLNANPSTGLVNDDVFYFGNAAGEVNRKISDVRINAIDLAALRRAISSRTVDISNVFDINKDGKVTAADYLALRQRIKAQPILKRIQV